MNYKILSLCLIVLIFAYNLVSYLCRKSSLKKELKSNVTDIYDENDYNKWQMYETEKNNLELLGSIIFSILIATVLSLNLLVVFEGIDNIYLKTFLIVSSFILLNELLDLPISYFKDIKLETKYGFNKCSKRTFIMDKIKGFIVSFLLINSLTSLLILLFSSIGDWVLLILFLIILVFIVFVAFVYPLFSKFYNKFVSLEEGGLREKLTSLLNKYGYKVNDIKVMDGSKRSNKANAYFAGLGKTKTIVLYDTIIDLLNEDELVAVFAHELAHGKYSHSKKSLLFSSLTILGLVFTIWGAVKLPLYQSFGLGSISYGLVIILVFGVIAQIVSLPFGLLSNFISRKHEYEADSFAAREGYGLYLISALKKLSKNSFLNLSPHPFIVLFNYSHPPLDKRIENIERSIKINLL